MGEDPATSVVDARCESHQVRNLIVCDSSSFPTSCGVNPMLSILTLARYQGRRLAAERGEVRPVTAPRRRSSPRNPAAPTASSSPCPTGCIATIRGSWRRCGASGAICSRRRGTRSSPTRTRRSSWRGARDGRWVGSRRSSTTRYGALHDARTGFFGAYECEDDRAASDALLNAAAAWLRARGMTAMRGPFTHSQNEEYALLVDGFDAPPVVQLAYNPPYYAELLEGYGLRRVRDLHAWWADANGEHRSAPAPRRGRAPQARAHHRPPAAPVRLRRRGGPRRAAAQRGAGRRRAASSP